MPFERQWDESCPRIWDQWEVGQKKFIIQDLDPADDEEALNILLTHFPTEEVMSEAIDMANDEKSMKTLAEACPPLLAQRMSLACYVEENGNSELAAVNCCIVTEKDSPKKEITDAGALLTMKQTLSLLKTRVNVFEMLETNFLLSGRGLVVKKEHRRAGIGTRMIAARKPLCLSQDLAGSDTVFTSATAQRSAEKCGYVTITSAALKEFADHGLTYSKDDDRVVKYMVNHFKDPKIMEELRNLN